LKFLFHFYDLHQRAGIQRAICELSNALVANHHEVVLVVGTEPSDFAFSVSPSVRVEVFRNPEPQKSGPAAWAAKFIWAARQRRFLRKAILAHRPDLVVDHGTALGLLYPFPRFAGRPFVLQRHFPALAFPNGRVLYRVLRSVSSHKPVVVLTEGIANEMRALGFRNLAVIPNPVPADAQFSPYAVASPRTGLLMGRAGNTQKGFDIFLRALSLKPIPGWRFLIVGPGVDQDPTLRELVCQLQNGNQVELRAATSEPYRLIQDCSCLIMPSRYEALPMVALEALTIGRPVLASSVDGMREVLEPGVNGILFRSDDAAALSSALIAIAEDPQKLAEMARNAPATVRKYGADAVVGLWLSYANGRLTSQGGKK
jgi:glycosyltransferase involved in cell wall biosynthesis